MKFQKNLNSNIIGPSKKYSTPIALDPAYYEGAIVYGDDGKLYFSDGTEWSTPAVDLPADVWRGYVDLDDNEIQSLTFPKKTTAETDSYVGTDGEITIDTTKNALVVHDGSAGGSTLVSESASQTISNKTLNLQDSTIVGLNGFGLSLSGSQLGVDPSVVSTLAGDQTITGTKTYENEIRINDPGGIRTNQASFNLIPQNATEVNIATGGTNVSISSSTGQTTINNTLVVGQDLIVNGDTFTTSTDVITLDDKVISLLDLTDSGDPEPTDSLADGGGIELNGTTIKEFKWLNATGAWTSSENIDIPADKSYLLDGNEVLSENTLGISITNSSLESVGILSTGRWEADTIATEYGGTGQTTYIDGQLLIGNTVGNTLTKARLSEGAGVTILNGNGQIEISNSDRGSLQNIFKNIVDSGDNVQFSASSNNDSLRFEGTGTTTITFNASNNAIIIDTPEAVFIPGDGISVSSNTISVDGTVVRTSGNQTIDGTKSFTSIVDADITGNAGTATALETPVTINGVSFDGTEDIVVSTTTSETLTAGDGLGGGSFDGASAATFTNADKGSDQNIFKNITDESDIVQFSADTNNDSLKFVAGLGTQINFNSADNSLTFISTGEEIEEPDVFKNIADSLGSIQFFADTSTDTIRFVSSGDLTDISFDVTNKAVSVDAPNVGDGLIIDAGDLSVDSSVVRTSDDQTIAGTKTFASTIVGNVNGNAATATALQTPITINGVSFDGTGDINILSASPETLIAGSGLTGGTYDGSASVTFDVDNTVVRTTGDQTIDGVKSYSSTIDGNINGNSGTATALETARSINGVPFDGTQDITISTVSTTTESLTAGDGLSGGTFDGSVATTFDVDSTVVRTTGAQDIGGSKTFLDTLVIGRDYTETLSFSTGDTTIDFANGTVFKITTDGNNTITLPSSVAGKSFILFVEYTGDHSITWTGGGTIYWPEGTPPLLTSVAGAVDAFVFVQDGTNTFGLSSAQGLVSV